MQQPESGARSEKARDTAHELNNLLGAIITFAQLARESLPADHPAAADLAEIGTAARQAVALVSTFASASTPPD